jgi:biotin carboxyl carrier protein
MPTDADAMESNERMLTDHTDGWVEAGEFPVVAERVVISPMPGRFEPIVLPETEVVIGQVVGEVVRSDERVPVVATTSGRFMGHLAERGERVRDGQPLAWIRLAG